MSTATTELTSTARRYLLDVEAELADLPAEERAELLEDLALHLSALEQERDEQPWETRLGPASDYARELRAAAGLPERGSITGGRRAQARHLLERLQAGRTVREVRAFLPQLRPAWWVLRGYLLVLALSLWSVDGSRDFPVPAPADSHLLGAVLTAAAVVASVALGQRRLPRVAAAGVLSANLALLVLAGNLLHDAPHRLAQVNVVMTDRAAGEPLLSRHGPVTNVFPYSADGRPLSGVLLFDQDGRPLRVGQQQWWPDGCLRLVSPPRAADGGAVSFSYPVRYVLAPGYLDQRSGQPVLSGRACHEVITPPKVPLPVFPAPAPARRVLAP